MLPTAISSDAGAKVRFRILEYHSQIRLLVSMGRPTPIRSVAGYAVSR
jgi:hypothetical protein